jgi:hypothetical protein
VVPLRLLDLLDDQGGLEAGVEHDLAQGASRARRMMSTPTFSSPRRLDVVEGLLAAEQRHAATGHDAFLDGRAGGVQRVLDAGLLLLHLGLGRGADVDDGHAAGQLGEALLELLAVVVGGGLLDLAA